MSNQEGVKAAVQQYLDGVAQDDAEKVAAAFHPQAVMTGHFNGEFMVIPNAGEFISTYVKSSAPIAETSPNLSSSIDSVEIAGSMANVTVSENGLEGANFTTYFHLHEVDGAWCIAAKATYAAV